MRGTLFVALLASAVALGIAGSSAAKKPHPKTPPLMMVTATPNPVIETMDVTPPCVECEIAMHPSGLFQPHQLPGPSGSDFSSVVQIEATPRLAGDTITVSSTQLASRCADGTGVPFSQTLSLTLDNDGNANVIVSGAQCAPGTALIVADVDAPPFSTVVRKLVIEPPQVTPPGLHGFPQPEVEVGDGGAGSLNAPSEADFVFLVEAPPVYAEQNVEITSDQLAQRCAGNGGDWFDVLMNFLGSGPGSVPSLTGGIDNDGNAVFVFVGASCAAGTSTVIADINTGPTYSTQVKILPPAVTI
jgi:hypothetical protein